MEIKVMVIYNIDELTSDKELKKDLLFLGLGGDDELDYCLISIKKLKDLTQEILYFYMEESSREDYDSRNAVDFLELLTDLDRKEAYVSF